MKRIPFVILIFILVFTSCKKDDETTSANVEQLIGEWIYIDNEWGRKWILTIESDNSGNMHSGIFESFWQALLESSPDPIDYAIVTGTFIIQENELIFSANRLGFYVDPDTEEPLDEILWIEKDDPLIEYAEFFIPDECYFELNGSQLILTIGEDTEEEFFVFVKQ